jgi:hypothetical protein
MLTEYSHKVLQFLATDGSGVYFVNIVEIFLKCCLNIPIMLSIVDPDLKKSSKKLAVSLLWLFYVSKLSIFLKNII